MDGFSSPFYTIQHIIGEGSTAIVYKAIHNVLNIPVAIKVINKTHFKTEDCYRLFLRELKVAMNVDHPLIVTLYDLIESPTQVGLVMEYVSGDNLRDFTNNNNPLSPHLQKKIFQQLIYALEYLHSTLHIIHRDLKMENILLDENKNIRIIDFGYARSYDPQIQCNTVCGSPAYSAPELITNPKYTEAVDVWASGVILYSLVMGRLPFYSENFAQLMLMIQNDPPLFYKDSDCSPLLKDLIIKILEKDHKKRITIDGIKHHQWFLGTDRLDISTIYNNPAFKITSTNHYDRCIINTLLQKGVDQNSLISDLSNGVYNSNTAMYRILRREQVTKKLASSLNNAFPNSFQYRQNSSGISDGSALPHIDQPTSFFGHVPSKTSSAHENTYIIQKRRILPYKMSMSQRKSCKPNVIPLLTSKIHV